MKDFIFWSWAHLTDQAKGKCTLILVDFERWFYTNLKLNWLKLEGKIKSNHLGIFAKCLASLLTNSLLSTHWEYFHPPKLKWRDLVKLDHHPIHRPGDWSECDQHHHRDEPWHQGKYHPGGLGSSRGGGAWTFRLAGGCVVSIVFQGPHYLHFDTTIYEYGFIYYYISLLTPSLASRPVCVIC